VIAVLVAFGVFAEPALVFQHVGVSQPNGTSSVLDQTVIVRGREIVEVGADGAIKVPEGAQVVDGRGKFLIPGLWDMHIHVLDEKAFPLFTANGVTGVRIMWGAPEHLKWREQAEKGEIVAPRLKVGSPIVDGPKPVWPGTRGVKNAEEARAAVQEYKKAGYDFIKVYSLLSRESYFAIADEAKKQGISFEGHIPYTVSQQEAIDAGQKSTEHLMGIVSACSTKDEEFRAALGAAAPEGMAKVTEVYLKMAGGVSAAYSEPLRDTLMASFAKASLWHTPTLVVLKGTSYMDELAKFKDPRMKYISPYVSASWAPEKDWRFKNRTAADWEAAKKSYFNNLGIVALMSKTGSKGKMLAGTDCFNPYVYPGFSLHEELQQFVLTGMTPGEALATATVNPARYYGEKSGEVKQGMRADLVLVDADPLVDIKNTTKISGVLQRGRWFDRAELDGLLKGAEVAAAQSQEMPQG
jgi:imidazolonepropionase-like amidohydrolase